jgi:ribosomal protein S18 acetylase RimI-like enzyme
MTCDDWRALPKREIAPLLEAEILGWQEQLGWDVRDGWRAIEPARAAGALPGFVARDSSGRVAGWTFFLEHFGSLQVAALAADTRDAAAALVDATLASDAAARMSACVWCVRGATPGLAGALAARGGDVMRYLYLSAPARAPRSASPHIVRLWRDDDDVRVAGLCERAYGDTGQVRAFAPHGTPDEWRDYIHGLRHTQGCGRFLPPVSLVDAGTGRLRAAMVVTEISHDNAHLAQIVVDPSARRQGWGRRLIGEALRRAGALGYQRLTLLVAEGNGQARALYDGLGFAAQAAFVVAVVRQPRRLSNVALASGGESTLRYAASVVPPRSSAATALRRASSASASADSES